MVLSVTDTFDGTGALSANWTKWYGIVPLQRYDGYAGFTALGFDAHMGWVADTFDDDQYVEIIPKDDEEWAGPILRHDSTSLFDQYVFFNNLGSLSICLIDSTTGWDELASESSTDYVGGSTYRFEAVGTSLVAKKDGSTAGMPSVSDSTYSGGDVGLCHNGTACFVDSWSAGNLADYACIYPSGYTLSAAELSRYPAANRYTSMTAAEADLNGVLTDDLYIEILHGDGSNNWDGTDDTTQVSWNGWDCSTNSKKVYVKTLVGDEYAGAVASRPDFSDGYYDSTEYRLYVSNAAIIFLNSALGANKFLNIVFEGIQIQSHTSGVVITLNSNQYTTLAHFKKCFVNNANQTCLINSGNKAGSELRFTNCIIESSGSGAVGQIVGGLVNVINCTTFGSTGSGWSRFLGILNIVNSIVGRTSDDFNGVSAGTNNCSDDDDGPGTNYQPVDGANDWDSDITTP